MPSTTTTGSVDIAVLDSKIVADLCAGNFIIDVTPSVFIGAGADNVLGAKVRVTNPFGVVVKDYPSGYDIVPPMTDVISVAIPTQANNYQYGRYIVDVQLTDEDGNVYTVTKPVTICAPNPLNKTVKYGSLSAQLNGVCNQGKLYVIADGIPTYQGKISDSAVNAFTLEYPTSSGLPVLSTQIGSFSTTLFEGVYKFSGTACANYNMGDNVSVKVSYQFKREKNVRCLLDEICIYARLSELNEVIKSDCTDKEKLATQGVIIDALRLLKTIEVAINSGFDGSDFVSELENVLGCVCTCNCAVGTPLINQNPTGDFVVEGCNVEVTQVGLTTHYQIDNYSYIVDVTDNGGVINISAPVLGSGCDQRQTLTFNIEALYNQVKAQINSTDEYNFWASVINRVWTGLDASCLGYDPAHWAGLTFAQRSQILFDAICAGGACFAELILDRIQAVGSDVVISWSGDSGSEVLIYLDGVLRGTVLGLNNFIIPGAADGNPHTYILAAKCSNGVIGGALTGTFTFFGCATVAPPTVSSNDVPDATCPYDLTALVDPLPAGVTAEWHNLNNHAAASLVADPTAVTGGTYYVFAVDSEGCYSLGTQVHLSCSTPTNCSAPQNLIVEAITGGNRIRFQSAAFPPPLSSYTVKRRLTSDPDVDGSYTTIGTPTFNGGVSRWEIFDGSADDNTVYTYRAISNCTIGTPHVSYDFANITCPEVTLSTPVDGEVDYSFEGLGGDIDKYDVKLYAENGTTLIDTQTFVPAFSSPITGSFTGLANGIPYKVQVRVWIGTTFKDCPLTPEITSGGDSWAVAYTNNDPAVNIHLQWGNHNTTPTVDLYHGLYSSDPVTGTDIDLPAVNANILMTISLAADPVVSANCNGVPGLISGGGTIVQWSGVNGALSISFITS